MSRISRFSPNWSDPDTLEAITVARESFIADAVDSVRESVLSKNKHHRLFVGPRGSGKTHLITLVRHRLVKMDDLKDELRIAWLNEDETSDTLLSLLLRVYRSFSTEYPVEFPADLAEVVFDLEDIREATLAITELLLKQLKDKTVLLLIENLDALFHTFSEAEQKSWRALMQNHPQFCTIATAQRLFKGVSSRSAPFFGFFQVEHLKPFTISEAAELFTKIAVLKKDEELKKFIQSFHGRARIRALHHLTGGNQRLFIILSEFIDRESLNSLVEPFEELVDEQLTPYYQERLRWVSPLQRRIVEYLCTIAKPEPVKAIARRLFSSSQTISKQLQELRKLGYVISRSRGRESFYELAEPLMRLSYQVKEARERAPLRLLVDFLRVWYDHQELLERMKLTNQEASLPRNYLSAAIMLYELEGNLRLRYFQEDADGIDVMNCNDEQIEALRVLMEESGDPIDYLRYVMAQGRKLRTKEVLDACTKLISMDKVSVSQLSAALFIRAHTYLFTGSPESAIRDCNQCLELDETVPEISVLAHVIRAVAHSLLGNVDAATEDERVVIESEEMENDALPVANLMLVEMSIKRKDWIECARRLRRGLASIDGYNQESLILIALGYILSILDSSQNPDTWRQGIVLLVDTFAENSSVSILRAGLIESIKLIRDSNLSAKGLSDWYSLWKEQAEKHPELELPMRLLRTAIDFFTAGEDTSVLLELTQEERRILEQVLGLEAEITKE